MYDLVLEASTKRQYIAAVIQNSNKLTNPLVEHVELSIFCYFSVGVSTICRFLPRDSLFSVSLSIEESRHLASLTTNSEWTILN